MYSPGASDQTIKASILRTDSSKPGERHLAKVTLVIGGSRDYLLLFGHLGIKEDGNRLKQPGFSH